MTRNLVPFIDKAGKKHDHYFVDSVSGIIYFKKNHAGKRIKFSTGFVEEQIVSAKRFANHEFNTRIGTTKKSLKTSLVQDELALWLKIKESEGHAYDTLNSIRRGAVEIEEFWGSRFPHEITRDNLVEWYEFWVLNHPEKQMENAVKWMRNFCRYLAEKTVNGRPILPAIPKIADPNYKENRRKRKKKKEFIFSNDDLKTILKTAESDRERLIVLFMYTMAARVTETLSLRFGQEIILDEDVPIYRWSDGQNKANKDGFHSLHPILIPFLNNQRDLSLALGTDRVFPQSLNPKQPLKEQQIDWAGWRKRANLEHHWTPHTFRHTCLSNLFNDPKNPQGLICILYRVSLSVAIDTYVKPTEEGRKLMREAIKVSI